MTANVSDGISCSNAMLEYLYIVLVIVKPSDWKYARAWIVRSGNRNALIHAYLNYFIPEL